MSTEPDDPTQDEIIANDYRKLACMEHGRDGLIEFDDDCVVDRARSPHGAWVAAWVFVWANVEVPAHEVRDCETPSSCGVCHECQRPQPCSVHGAP